MYDFLRIQYRLGRLTAAQVWACAPRWITWEQAEEIIGTATESPVGERGGAG